MCNHIHLCDIVRNPIHQIVVADVILEQWKALSRELPESAKVVAYWNGPVDSVLCIYLANDVDEAFLEAFDARIRMRNVRVREV